MILAPTLTLSAGSGAAIVRPTFSRDFAGEKTLNNGTGPAITFTRASGATYFDANGDLQTAANDVARFDHDPLNGNSRGLLIEEQRTNSIRNSQAGGSTNGVIGSGGAAPTQWSIGDNNSGLAVEVVGTGTEAGFSYIDIRYYGTALFASELFAQPDFISATVGQTWTGSIFVRQVAGSTANIVNAQLNTRTGSAGNPSLAIANSSDVLSALGGFSSLSRARITSTVTATDATTASASTYFALTYNSGAVIDLTLRIAAPQLELGAFPTSYIPTTTAAATRSADSAVVTPISSFYNPVESTIFSELSGTSVAFDSTIVAINNTTQNEQLDQRLAITSVTSRTRVGGVNQANIAGVNPVVAPVSGTTYKFASAHKLDDFAASMDGATVVTDTAGSMPSGLSRMEIGRRDGSGFLTGHIRKIAYYPKRLTNALLEQLTT